MTKAPVALFVFNRPATTARVLKAIASAKPKKLLVIADGPRSESMTDTENCNAVRQLFESLEWDCEIQRNFADKNMGCKYRLASGLDWVFEQCEEAIILEDDTLPHKDFFPFCEDMLQRYRNNPDVFMIRGHGGNDAARTTMPADYYLSRWHSVWGWASWSRSWQQYDVEMTDWPELRDTRWLENTLPLKKHAKLMRHFFDRMHAGDIDSWEFQLFFAGWKSSSWAITPFNNLITNIGFGSDGTHMQDASNPLAERPLQALKFPLKHPAALAVNNAADINEWNKSYGQQEKNIKLVNRLKRQLKKLIN